MTQRRIFLLNRAGGMCRRTGALLVVAGWLVLGVSVVQAVPTVAQLDEAKRAIARGAGEVAGGMLDRLLQEGGLPEEIRLEASILRAQRFLEAGACAQAEALLVGLEQHPVAALCLAETALHAQRWNAAADRFAAARAVGADEMACALGRAAALPPAGREAEAVAELRALLQRKTDSNKLRLTLAGLLVSAGEVAEARALAAGISAATPLETWELALLLARSDMVEGHLDEAASGFAALLEKTEPIPAEIYTGALLGRADVLERRGDALGAARSLLASLKSGRELPCPEPVFQKAAALLAASPNPSETELRDCVREGAAEYRALLRFYLAQFYFSTGRGVKGAAELQAFCSEFPTHRLKGAALLQRAEQAMEQTQWSDAGTLLAEAASVSEEPRLIGLIQMRQGAVAFRTGAFEKALAAFDAAAKAWKGLQTDAVFNAGLAAARQGNLRRAQSDLAALGELPGAGELVVELELEMALRRAFDGQAQAEEALQAFVRKHPGHPRLGDARVALAEICVREAALSQGMGGSQQARSLREKAATLLQTVANDQQSPQAAAQAKFLAVFLADAAQPRREDEVLQSGELFLREFPGSALVAEMRMKLGEVYFRRKDYAKAEEHFATLAKLQPEGTLSETALYLAGQCAASRLNPGSVDDAFRYWQTVAQGNGPLRWKARYQQAAVKGRIGEPGDAAELYDRILNAKEGVDPDLRWAAHCGKADALLELAKQDASVMEAALSEYRSLAGLPKVPPYWRNQALYKMARAVEASDPKLALETFQQVVDAPGSAEASEFFWLYKSGFAAARILERRQVWRDSVALYERLGRMGGPRAADARARALQIRLEHFLWD